MAPRDVHDDAALRLEGLHDEADEDAAGREGAAPAALARVQLEVHAAPQERARHRVADGPRGRRRTRPNVRRRRQSVRLRRERRAPHAGAARLVVAERRALRRPRRRRRRLRRRRRRRGGVGGGLRGRGREGREGRRRDHGHAREGRGLRYARHTAVRDLPLHGLQRRRVVRAEPARAHRRVRRGGQRAAAHRRLQVYFIVLRVRRVASLAETLRRRGEGAALASPGARGGGAAAAAAVPAAVPAAARTSMVREGGVGPSRCERGRPSGRRPSSGDPPCAEDAARRCAERAEPCRRALGGVRRLFFRRF